MSLLITNPNRTLIVLLPDNISSKVEANSVKGVDNLKAYDFGEASHTLERKSLIQTAKLVFMYNSNVNKELGL